MQKQKQTQGTSRNRALCDCIGCVPMKSALGAEYAKNYKPWTCSTWAISQGFFQWQTLNTETMFLSWTVQYLYFEILTPNMTVLGYGAFGRSVGHEVGAPVKGCILIRREREHLHLDHVRYRRNGSLQPRSRLSLESDLAGTLISNFYS